MVRVFYSGKLGKTNAWLGGVLFRQGVAEFENNDEGILFAKRFYKEYEIVELEPKIKKEVKKPTKKKVNKIDK